MKTGEIVVRPVFPYSMMQGYLGMPEETIKACRNLWFHTGDAGYLDHSDNLFFVDRIKERIRRRAENISAYDIEYAASCYPLAKIQEAAAVGVPSTFEGDDDIMLFIVTDTNIEAAALLRFLTTRLPPFMVPRYIEIIDALPRTATNKVKRRELSALGVRESTWDRAIHNVRLREIYEEQRQVASPDKH
jgi:crotonobetaine/carnitine-CoA ligase